MSIETNSAVRHVLKYSNFSDVVCDEIIKHGTTKEKEIIGNINWKRWYTSTTSKERAVKDKIIKRIASRIKDSKFMRMTEEQFNKFVTNVKRKTLCWDEYRQQYLLKDGTWTYEAPSREYKDIVSLCCGYDDPEEGEGEPGEPYMFCFEYGVLGNESVIRFFS